jgi:hypothetical protein
MTRKEKRELRKDKSLVCALYNIIDKYLPKLFTMFEELTDKRQQGKVTYDMKVICITRLFGLLCGITTMNSLTNKFNNTFTIDTISKITNTKLDDLPHYDTINDVFDDLNIEELRKIQKYIVYALIRSKMFDKFRYNGKFQLLIDGTGLVSFNHKHCDHCLVKKHSDNHLTYEHNVLEAKLVFDSFVLSIDSEFIENPNSDVVNIRKQDCEMNAFKRMAKRIKKNFPKLKFIVTGDALYASGPFIKLCLDNNWDYIFRLKSDRLKTVNQDFDGIISIDSGSYHKNYYIVKDYQYNKYKFNIIRFIEYNQNIDNKTFTFITNLVVTDNNIKTLISMGRRRWKIENNGFNNQKNILFNISHMCSLDYNAMKAHYLFIQFAHTIRQLLDFGSNLVLSFEGKLKEISFAILSELTSSHVNVYLNHNFQLRFDKLII